MLDLNQIIAFLAAAVVLTLMPGPDIIFVTAQSMTRSRRSGIAVALGLCTGLIAHTAAAALGVSAAIAASQAAYQIIRALGAAYLLYIAWKAWNSRNRESSVNGPRSDDALPAESLAALYRRGILMNISNPKVLLFFLALLPQFVRPDTGSVAWQMLQLGLLFMLQSVVIFCAVAVLASLAGSSLTRRSSKWNRNLAIAESIIYVVLAANLLWL